MSFQRRHLTHSSLRWVPLILALGLLLSSPAVEASSKNFAPQPLDQVFDAYWQGRLELDPVLGSDTSGDEKYHGRLEISFAPEVRAKQQDLLDSTERALNGIQRQRLDPEARRNVDLLRREIQIQREQMRFPDDLLPIDHYGGLPATLAEFATGQSIQPLRTVAHYEAFLQRLLRLPAWNAQAIANMRVGMARGVVQPRVLIERALQTLRPLLTSDAEHHAYTLPLRNFPADFDAATRERLSAAYRTALSEQLLPSMQTLAHFLEREYLPATRASAGLSALPDGAAWYAQALRHHTTTTLDAERIHAIGLQEVARIRGEMDAIRRQLGYDGPLTDFLSSYRDRPGARPFKSEREVLDAYVAIDQRVRPHLPRLFSTLPAAALDIRPEPEISRATASHHYTSPSADGQRPGIFWAVIQNPADYEKSEMVSLFLHEGQPGHHFHSALQMNLPLPDFRKYDWITAYGEGWALYAETLGHEMGLYANDPDALLGHLRLELLRAVRLVTDTGLHAKGWTREQSMRYMMETEGATEAEARRATERYMANPGQATAYKIGALKIRELRDRAQKRLGDRFSYAAFHEQILGEGSLPLDLLEAKIDHWLKSAP